jgi:branched-chain amino acid transport system substrate-binding protein
MTGPIDWFGEQYLRGADMAVKDINARGGVLGQMVHLISGDDFCEANQAEALARKLVSDGVVFVAGHFCSHASIAAAKIYEEAGVLQISPGSVAAKLTEEGRPNVFRVCGRADRQGAQIGNYLADKWAGKQIAVLDDGSTFGADIANGVRLRLHERNVQLTVDESFTPGEPNYFALVSRMQTAGVDVFFVGGLHREAGLMFRQAHDQGYDLQLVASSAFATGDFPIIAGPAIANTPMVAAADARQNPQAKIVVERLQAQGYEPMGFTLYAYAAVPGLGPGGRACGVARPQCGDKVHARPPV